MPRLIVIVLILLGSLVLTAACQKQEDSPKTEGPPATTSKQPPTSEERKAAEGAPPTPPIREDFEGEPKLSLFPRVGDFRPEDDDKEGLSYWATYIDHLSRTSGVLTNKDTSKGRAFGFRSIKAVDSVGYFSPLAVTPDTSYRVSYRLWSNLSPGGTTGIGILEFNEFLFIADQFPRSLSEKHFQRSQLGMRLTDDHDGKVQSFTFRTGPQTRMIHLVFFREGTPDRNPVIIDDIEIKPE